MFCCGTKLNVLEKTIWSALFVCFLRDVLLLSQNLKTETLNAIRIEDMFSANKITTAAVPAF